MAKQKYTFFSAGELENEIAGRWAYQPLGLLMVYASKLAVALVIANSGCIQGKVLPSEVDYTIKLACKNLIERGHLDNTSPEAAAESMSKMRSMI